VKGWYDEKDLKDFSATGVRGGFWKKYHAYEDTSILEKYAACRKRYRFCPGS